jgi:hypothetical protein
VALFKKFFAFLMLTISGFSSPSPCAKGSTFNPECRRSWAAQAKPAIGIALAMGVLTAGQAQAVVVNVGGQDWDVTTFTGTYNANTSKFATAANGGVMPWWGNEPLATEFASALQDSLGSPNDNASPFFGFHLYATSTMIMCSWSTGTWPLWCAGVGTHWVVTWAQATATSVPGPLPLFGVAAALGYSRKLRTRINRSTKIGSGTDCL